MKNIPATIAIYLLLSSPVACQSYLPASIDSGYQHNNSEALSLSPDRTVTDHQANVDVQRLCIVTGITITTLGALYAAHIEPWWSGEKQGFRFKFDWLDNQWLEIDKLGHFYSNIQLTRLSAASFRFAGVSERRSLWNGFLVSTAFFTSIELTDAGFADWGFSVPDFTANLLGALYPILQYELPALQRFNFKLSYRPSRFYKNSSASGEAGFINYQPYTYPSGDYDGVRYWLSADINWLLPGRLQPYWPDWLNLAAGYGARNLPQANHAIKERDFYFALDFNTDYLPGESKLMRTIKHFLNAVHLPAPALRISRSGTTAFILKI